MLWFGSFGMVVLGFRGCERGECLLWSLLCLGRFVVVYVKRSPRQNGRNEAGDQCTQVVEGLRAAQE